MSSPTASSSSEERRRDEEKPSTAPAAPAAAASLAPPKPKMMDRFWKKTGLNPIFVMLMIKGALAPTICIAAYQADKWAHQYTTLGYLAAIMSMLALPIQPRAKFMQSMTVSILFTCTAAALAMFQMACVVTARQNTTAREGATEIGSSGSQQSVQYNSSASVVACVFLFVYIWIGNCVRAYRPQLMLPSVQFCIFSIVACTYSPSFPYMASAESFCRRLLITFLTGFGVATGVSLFVFPITSRKLATVQMGGLVQLTKALLTTHGDYMYSMTMAQNREPEAEEKAASDAKKLRGLVAQVSVLYAKIRLEIGFARKEIAFGKWEAEDFSLVFKHFRNLLLPAIGLSTFLDIMQSVKKKQAVDLKRFDSSAETLEAIRRLETEEWDEVLTMSHEPYTKLRGSLVQGLDHFCLQLEITKRPKKKKGDVEEKGDSLPKPGEAGFSDYLENEVQKFHIHRETVIQRWCASKGIDLPAGFHENATTTLKMVTTEVARKTQNQHQLYLILYIEFLMYAIGKAIVDMVRFADSKVADGTMSKTRPINPGWRRIRKLLESSFEKSDGEEAMVDKNAGGTQVWVGDSLKHRLDPEHLPPTTFYQRVTHHLRTFPTIMSSPEASFAFRAATATVSLGILAYIHQTASFFLQQRGLWALIMVAIGMSPNSGAGVFGFGARILGTFVAMCVSLALWYIGYKQPGAIIPLFFIYLMGGFLFLIKNPTLVTIGMISMVTGVLIIGYELQAGKIGETAVAANGQPFYNIYLLAPYRLACVIVGLATAFFWTYFPYPVTTHTTLRKDLGATLYLLANFYSVVHATVETRMQGIRAPEGDKTCPSAKLEKARLKVLSKMILMLGRLREHSNFTRFEPTFGGKFPKAKYDGLIESIDNIFHYLSLISYSSAAFIEPANKEESAWLEDFRRFTSEVSITSHEITRTLCLVSASMSTAQPLPPYVKVPRPYGLAEKMESVDPEILSVKHVHEPCYAAFAVLEVASTLVTEELTKIVETVKELVGEVDFSFHIVNPEAEGPGGDGSVPKPMKGKVA